MGRRFRIAGGKEVIWTGETDTLPFDNPDAHPDRVLFSSTWPYTSIITKRTVNVSFPSADPGDERRGTINLFAHGVSGVPRVRGNITVAGQKLSLGCHVPIQTRFNSFFNRSTFRLAVIGATTSQVVLMWYANMLGFGNVDVGLPAITLPITVEVTNELN